MEITSLSKAQLKNDVPRVARYCADEIQRNGQVPNQTKPNKLQLHNAAVELTLRIVDIEFQIEQGVDDPDVELDLYQNMEELVTELPVALLAAGTSENVRNRRTVHEIATHLQRTKVASEVYDADLVICGGMDGRRVRHHIARRVEELLFG